MLYNAGDEHMQTCKLVRNSSESDRKLVQWK